MLLDDSANKSKDIFDNKDSTLNISRSLIRNSLTEGRNGLCSQPELEDFSLKKNKFCCDNLPKHIVMQRFITSIYDLFISETAIFLKKFIRR